MILPTAYPWEGQPLSIIEALAHGIPVLSTSFRGIPEQVIDGFNGYMVRHGEPGTIVSAVLRATDSDENYRRLSQGACRHYQEFFTREKHISEMFAVLQVSPPG